MSPGSTASPSRAAGCAPRATRCAWGDLHGHSGLFDGTGTPDDYYRYARDVSGLDLVSLTDPDHWGLLRWPTTRSSGSASATPRCASTSREASWLGFEWTSSLSGHRHVLYFGDEGAAFDSVAEATDTPPELWAALEALGEPALTIAHHPGGGPVAIDWDIAPDPRFEL